MGSKCQGQEEDTSPVQMSPRCRWTNLASGDDGGCGEMAVLPQAAAVGSWESPCQGTCSPRAAKNILVWVSAGQEQPWLHPRCRAAGTSRGAVEGGSLRGGGDLRSVGNEDASSILHWRRASQGLKPEGLGGFSTFCSAGPYLLSVLTWPGPLENRVFQWKQETEFSASEEALCFSPSHDLRPGLYETVFPGHFGFPV